MRFSHNSNKIILYGVKPKVQSCLKISGRKLKGLLRKGGVAQVLQLSPVLKTAPQDAMPANIQNLLN
jgi:hypothetical protein